MSKCDDKGKGKARAKAEEDDKNWGYMRWASVQSLYKELTDGSLDNAVDALWLNILPLYFRVEYNYAIEAQANPGRTSKKNADLAVRCVRYVSDDFPGRIILIENRRVGDEGSDVVWSEAVLRLVECMDQACATGPETDRSMYGIVTVGHYSRYYTFCSGAATLSDFSSRCEHYTGQPLHFKHDELSMHTLLKELVELTCQ